MTDPIFPEVVIGPAVYISIGILLSIITVLSAYIIKIKYRGRRRPTKLNLKKLNMPESRIKILESIVNESEIQSNLPDITGYSKATVSQALDELNSQRLIKRKKRGNSYLIEPNTDRIKEVIDEI